MKAYFYCRVAHDDSFSLERQAEELRRIGRDWGMTKQYIALLTEHKVKLLCLRERVSSDISGVSPFST